LARRGHDGVEESKMCLENLQPALFGFGHWDVLRVREIAPRYEIDFGLGVPARTGVVARPSPMMPITIVRVTLALLLDPFPRSAVEGSNLLADECPASSSEAFDRGSHNEQSWPRAAVRFCRAQAETAFAGPKTGVDICKQ
jgi:hypothetical protein